MTSEELRRYSRHIRLQDIGLEGQEKLKAAKVLVIGAGGLGCPILQYLTAAGVGTLGIIDNDVVDESNLQRQVIYTIDDVGKSKAETAAKRLSQLNPFVEFVTFNFELLTSNALEIIPDFDIVIDGSDNFPTRYLVNDACVILGKPLVFGSIFKFDGQVAVFNYLNGPTYRCLYPEPPASEDVPNCSQVGVLGVLPGIIGSLQANEALKIILGIGEVLSGQLFCFDALTMQSYTLSFEKDKQNSNIKELTDYKAFCQVPPTKQSNNQQFTTYNSSSMTLEQNANPDYIKEISAQQLAALLQGEESIQVIDVREPWEFEICHIGGELIPMQTIPNYFDKVAKDKPVIVHCHHGVRSANVIHWLQKTHGFTNLYNLEGGIHAWSEEVDSSVATY